MTAFFTCRVDEKDAGGGRLVTRAKKARSDFRGGQGREPRRPMPRFGVVATIKVRDGKGGGMGGSVAMLPLWGGMWSGERKEILEGER